jgi:UDP-N-acetyl-2-amino-2-deoxyglucuronate dehydrogenase
MEKQVGVAILGLGRWSRQLAAAVARTKTMKLLTCYSRSAENRQAFAGEFGIQDTQTLEEALTFPGVEAAIISSPSHTHLELTRECARQNLHIFVEKAMANTYEESLQMIAEVRHRDLVLMVGHEMRRLGSTRAMKRLLEEGRIGRPVMANGIFTLAGTFIPDNWRCHRETNHGGALMQLGIHQVENLIYLLGPVNEVRGFFAHVSAPVDVDDVGMATLSFESGAVATVVSDFVSPSAYELHLYGEKANLDCVVDMRVWPDSLKVDSNTSLTFQTRALREAVPIEPQDPLAQELDEFARCVRGEAAPETGAEQGLAAMVVVEAALRSFATNMPVDPRAL